MTGTSRLGALLLGFALLQGCKLKESVVIDAPVEVVWSYVSNIDHAPEWSVYFHHITPLPGMPDGDVGSVRRWFRSEAETDGIRWDERVLELRPPRYRRILAYNARGFADPVLNAGEFYVEQIYEPVGSDQTRLTFSAEQRRPSEPHLRARFLRAAREGRRIFRLNLENIKASIEARQQGRPYKRIHPYIPPGQHSLDPRQPYPHRTRARSFVRRR